MAQASKAPAWPAPCLSSLASHEVASVAQETHPLTALGQGEPHQHTRAQNGFSTA